MTSRDHHLAAMEGTSSTKKMLDRLRENRTKQIIHHTALKLSREALLEIICKHAGIKTPNIDQCSIHVDRGPDKLSNVLDEEDSLVIEINHTANTIRPPEEVSEESAFTEDLCHTCYKPLTSLYVIRNKKVYHQECAPKATLTCQTCHRAIKEGTMYGQTKDGCNYHRSCTPTKDLNDSTVLYAPKIIPVPVGDP